MHDTQILIKLVHRIRSDMSQPDCTFAGWAGVNEQAVKGGMVFKEFEPKAWDEDDVDGEMNDISMREQPH